MMRPLSALTATLLAVLLIAPAKAEQFQFNPPDGTTFVVSVRTTKVTTLGALGKRTEDRETSERVQVTRTADGFSIAATALYGTINRDGEKIESPILKAPIGLTFTYEVDSRGQLKAIRGFDQLLARMKAALPPGALETMSPAITEEALVNRESAEWDGRITRFVGREVKIGDAWTSKDRFDLPTGGVVHFTTTTRIVGREPVEGRDCVRVKFSYTGSAPAPPTPAVKPIGKSTAKKPRARKAVKPKPPAASTSISGGGERLVDPATMLIYGESLSRTLKMPVTVPGSGSVLATVVEKKQYRYQRE
jgi:hypothetical protein